MKPDHYSKMNKVCNEKKEGNKVACEDSLTFCVSIDKKAHIIPMLMI